MGPLQWYKNAVVCGDVDFCCLLCELTFRTEDDVARHIRDQKHTEALIASSYSHNHSTELIRKIKRWYYCEPCNTVLSSSRKVTSHLAEDKHQLNKTAYQQGEIRMANNMVKRVGQNVIVCDELLIEELAWNAIVDMSCIVCDIDLDNISSHIVTMDHVLKLIRIKVHSGIGYTLFRKIDDTLFQCLTCNTIIQQNSFVIHWDTADHEKAHTKCRIAKCEAIPTERAVPANTNNKVLSENVERDIASNKVDNNKELINDERKPEVTKNEKQLDIKSKVDDSKKNENASGARPKSKVSTKEGEKIMFGQQKNNTQPEAIKTKTKNIDSPLLDLNKELGIKNYSWIQDDGYAKCILCDWAMEPSEVSRHTNSDHHRMIEKLHKEDLKYKQVEEKKRNESKKSTEPNNLNKANQTSSLEKSNDDKPILDETMKQQKAKNITKVNNGSYTETKNETTSGDVGTETLDMVVDLQKDDHHRMIGKLHKEELENKHAKGNNCNGGKHSTERNKLNKANSSEKSNDNKHKMDEIIKQQETTNITKEDAKESYIKTKKHTISGDVKTEILNMIVDLQKDDVQIDFICDKAYCKRCNKTLNFDPLAIKLHIKDHKDVKATIDVANADKIESASGISVGDTGAKPKGQSLVTMPVILKKPTKTKSENSTITGDLPAHTKNLTAVTEVGVASKKGDKNDDIDNFSKVNDITFNKGNPNAYCRTCQIKIPSTMKCLEEHGGVKHRNKTASKNKPPSIEEEIETIDMSEPQYAFEKFRNFIEHRHQFNNIFIVETMYNKLFCLGLSSFCLCKETNDNRSMTCFCCATSFPRREFMDHVNGFKHKIYFDEVPVIVSLKKEFVREVSSGKFHCGFCHEIVRSWNSLKQHLKTPAHENMKRVAEERLETHRPMLRAHDSDDDDEMRLFRLLTGMGGGRRFF